MYTSIVFLQGSSADEALSILNNEGEKAVINFLLQWDYNESNESYDQPQAGILIKPISMANIC